VRDIPDPGFAGDDGSASAEVTAALAAYAAAPDHRYAEALAVVQHARLLVPVVAVPGDTEDDATGEKTSDMASVLLRGRDGRAALLAFTGIDGLRRWHRDARPVPVSCRRAAEAARQDGAAAMVIDVAGPVKFVVAEEDLGPLAQGYTLADLNGRFGWVRAAG
jgi:hypothetical protein